MLVLLEEVDFGFVEERKGREERWERCIVIDNTAG